MQHLLPQLSLLVFLGCPSPQVAQRDALSAKVPSQARSMLALFTSKGSEIPLPDGTSGVRKDAIKPNY